MKSLLKSMLLICLTWHFSTAQASTEKGTPVSSGAAMTIFKGKVVTPGSAVVANICLTNSETVQAVVSNLSGKDILDTPITMEAGENQFRMHLGELPSGIYFLKIVTSEGTLTRSFYVK